METLRYLILDVRSRLALAEGQAMLDYVLILALVAVLSLTALKPIGTAVVGQLNQIADVFQPQSQDSQQTGKTKKSKTKTSKTKKTKTG